MRNWRRLGIQIGSLIFLNVLEGCDLPDSHQPSVLMVAVEGLSFESLSCDAEDTNDRTVAALRPFCEEAVRFSHAFAPSTMSQATMASLMTGLYPFDHGVHHNGSDFLSAKFKTLAEGALMRGYHTLFVTGGAPIWRKSGLAQGFEVFDDNIDISPGVYYRPAREVVKATTNWIEHDSLAAPFLAVLYLNDLQFPQIATHTVEGELREKTSDAQLEEVAESLTPLVRWLKNHRRWNSTNFILVGLNSLQHHENDTEPLPLSLKSASVQVTLFIKPARKRGDSVAQWAVDRNVSLVDVGKTMFEWMGLEPPASSIAELEPESLATAVQQSEPDLREGRLILSETAWPDWLEGAGRRTAVRQNQMLYIHDKTPLIFNTLTDHLETLPLKSSDPLWASLNGDVIDLIKKVNTPAWQGLSPHWPEQIEVARDLWRNNLYMRHPTGTEAWSKWYARRALRAGDWPEVKRLALVAGDPVGVFVAERHLNENAVIPANACLRMVLGDRGSFKHSDAADCGDERVLALHSWQNAKSEEERLAAQERFVRLYSLQLVDQEIGRLNFLNELRWDVDREIPDGPLILDYLLTLKELEPIEKRVSGLLSTKDMAF